MVKKKKQANETNPNTKSPQKTRKPLMIGIIAVFIVAIAAVGVFAMGLSNLGGHKPQGPMGNGAFAGASGYGTFGHGGLGNQTAVLAAIKSNDYTAYMTALENNWQTFKSQMTQDKFDKIVAAYNASSQRMAQFKLQYQSQNQNATNASISTYKLPMRRLGMMHKPMHTAPQNTTTSQSAQ